MARLLVECAVRGTLIATVTAVILWATRIKTPVALHAAWTGVLLSMLLLPVWTAWGPRTSMRVLPPVPASLEILAAPAETVVQVPQPDRRPLETVEATAQTQACVWAPGFTHAHGVHGCDVCGFIGHLCGRHAGACQFATVGRPVDTHSPSEGRGPR